MSNKISNPLFLLIAFLLATGLYWPTLAGSPIWDDFTFWFKDPVITKEFSYFKIWKDFAWPLSVSAQKVLFNLLGDQYWAYHALNLLLHFLNSWLLLLTAQKLKFNYPRYLFLFFLFHPVNVISVSWMIQLKTLLCFLFGLLSFLCLMKFFENKKWILPAWILFLFSMLSKSASLPLPVFFALFFYRKVKAKQFLWLLPFFLLSALGAYRLLNSPVTIESVAKLESKPMIAAETEGNLEKKTAAKPEVKPEIKPEQKPTTKPEIKPKTPEQPLVIETSLGAKIQGRMKTFLATLHYYFWQTLLPLSNAPVKGLNYTSPGAMEYIHLGFLILIIIINWGTSSNYYLAGGYFLLLPFLGLLPAPYMNLTWVSDQHLYLALPFFVCFWLSLVKKWKWKYSLYVPMIFLPLYFYQLRISSSYYQDEFTFFEASLEADALNVPIAYNLAIAYMNKGDLNEALNITSSMISMAQVSEEVRKNQYFTYIYILHVTLTNSVRGNP